jgi:hypothetical protein
VTRPRCEGCELLERVQQQNLDLQAIADQAIALANRSQTRIDILAKGMARARQAFAVIWNSKSWKHSLDHEEWVGSDHIHVKGYALDEAKAIDAVIDESRAAGLAALRNEASI